jgi:hypothetical protein
LGAYFALSSWEDSWVTIENLPEIVEKSLPHEELYCHQGEDSLHKTTIDKRFPHDQVERPFTFDSQFLGVERIPRVVLALDSLGCSLSTFAALLYRESPREHTITAWCISTAEQTLTDYSAAMRIALLEIRVWYPL